MPSVHGAMSTDRPERYARQLVKHWSARGPVTDQDGAIVQRWADGRVITLRPRDGELGIEVTVPEGEDAERFSHVVAEHLQRFGRRDELHVEWESETD